MRYIIRVLDGSGDFEIHYDPKNEAEASTVRETLADLERKGYSFFLADGQPADAFAAGNGTLVVKRVRADAILANEPPASPPALEEVQPEGGKKRSRLRVKQVIAVPPMRGG